MDSNPLSQSIPQPSMSVTGGPKPMPTAVQVRLLTLNQEFYAAIADEFDSTRQSIPFGMATLATQLAERAPSGPILDVGCGNGRFARALVQAGYTGRYFGIDADARLLALAQSQTADNDRATVDFQQVDLVEPGWPALLHQDGLCGAVVCLAVIHHFPSFVLRQRLVADMAHLLAPGGVLALSTWQFLATDRIAQKQIAWEAIGVSAADVEPGDALLPWNQGTYAIRYVHQLELPEVEALAVGAGLAVTKTFRADGKEGNLNLYALLERET
jgi:tRNA (uracil-5-)-methyltransferase TRM9